MVQIYCWHAVCCKSMLQEKVKKVLFSLSLLYISKYMPRDILEATYGFMLPKPNIDDGEDPDRLPAAHEVLTAHACKTILSYTVKNLSSVTVWLCNDYVMLIKASRKLFRK